MIVTGDTIQEYVDMTGDKNPFHQKDYMARFGKRAVVPGLLLLSYAIATSDKDMLKKVRSADVLFSHPMSAGDHIRFETTESELETRLHGMSGDNESIVVRFKYDTPKYPEEDTNSKNTAYAHIDSRIRKIIKHHDDITNMLFMLGYASSIIGEKLQENDTVRSLIGRGYRAMYLNLCYSFPNGISLGFERDIPVYGAIDAKNKKVQGLVQCGTDGAYYTMNFRLGFLPEKIIIKRYAKDQ